MVSTTVFSGLPGHNDTSPKHRIHIEAACPSKVPRESVYGPGDSDDHQETKETSSWADQAWFPEDGNLAERVFQLFEDPTSSRGSLFMAVFIMLLILLSSIIYVLGTLPQNKYPQYDNGNGVISVRPAFANMELTAMIMFLAEYLGRVLCVPFCRWFVLEPIWKHRPGKQSVWMSIVKLKSWALVPMNIVDFLAVVPYFITLAMGAEGASLSFLRILRLARVFRIFKVGRHAEGLKLFTSTLSQSVPALNLTFFNMSLMVLVSGSVMYEMEVGTYDETANGGDGAYMRPDLLNTDEEESPFWSIWQATWWVFSTISSVGYGDIYPTTPWGKIIACVTMYGGVILLAMPVTIMQNNFGLVYESEQRIKHIKRMEKMDATLRKKPFLRKHSDETAKAAQELVELRDLVDENNKCLHAFINKLKTIVPPGEEQPVYQSLKHLARRRTSEIGFTNLMMRVDEEPDENLNKYVLTPRLPLM